MMITTFVLQLLLHLIQPEDAAKAWLPAQIYVTLALQYAQFKNLQLELNFLNAQLQLHVGALQVFSL